MTCLRELPPIRTSYLNRRIVIKSKRKELPNQGSQSCQLLQTYKVQKYGRIGFVIIAEVEEDKK